MLTREDLEAIRAIVREELARALTTPEDRRRAEEQRRWGDGFRKLAEMAPKKPHPDSSEGALRELARADVARMRREPGADERHLLAVAAYRVRFDESHQKRARRTLGKAPDAALTDEDMMSAMKLWASRRKPKAQRRR
jgi:hypothetical protein